MFDERERIEARSVYARAQMIRWSARLSCEHFVNAGTGMGAYGPFRAPRRLANIAFGDGRSYAGPPPSNVEQWERKCPVSSELASHVAAELISV